jgi:FkbM family methyltransferase
MLPGDAPGAIYTTLLRPAPLRAVTNRVLRRLIPAEIALPEGRLYLNPDDPVVSGALALGVFERQVSARFRAEVGPGMTVVDVGANLGYYSVIALGRSAPAGRLIAFEPDPANHALLLRNLRPFGDRATVLRRAVAAAPGTLTLHRHRDDKGKHSVFAAPDLDAGISVEAVTLDAALLDLGRPRVDVIKLDVEGAEPLALAGVSETSRSTGRRSSSGAPPGAGLARASIRWRSSAGSRTRGMCSSWWERAAARTRRSSPRRSRSGSVDAIPT